MNSPGQIHRSLLIEKQVFVLPIRQGLAGQEQICFRLDKIDICTSSGNVTAWERIGNALEWIEKHLKGVNHELLSAFEAYSIQCQLLR